MVYYVINLDRSPERWRFMEAMCVGRGLRVERVPAVDGLAMSAEQLERVCPLVDGFLPLATTEVGCFESHKEAWRRIAAGDDSHACVLEDDVFLAKGVGALCDEVLRAFPQLDLVKLNNTNRKIMLSHASLGSVGAVQLYRPMRRTIDAGAYLITRECARAVLAAFDSYRDAVDDMLFDPASGRAIAQLAPAVAMQQKYAEFPFLDEVGSTSLIHGSRVARLVEERQRNPKPPTSRALKELTRAWNRRIASKALIVASRFRPRDEWVSWRQIDFADPVES